MAKKHRGPGRPKKEVIVAEKSRFHLSNETKHSILVIFLLCLAVLIFLSIFGLAGNFGEWVIKVMQIIFGRGYALFVVLLTIFSILMINPEKYKLTGFNYLGLILFTLGYCGLFHIKVPLDISTQEALAGTAGGYIGWFISYPLLKVMDFWGTLVVLIALLVIGLFLSFNISIQDIKAKGVQTKNFWSRLTAWMFIKLNKEELNKLKEIEENSADEYDIDEDVYSDNEAVTPTVADTVEEHESVDEINTKTPIPVSHEISAEQKVLVSTEHIQINLPNKLLKPSSTKPTSGDVEATKAKIKTTFENFNIEVEMGEISIGPTVTQYTLAPAEGVKLSRIVALNNDLALALAAHPIRIEAPIPGKSLVGIEVPNESIATVSLREVIDSSEFQSNQAALPVALGKDVAGKTWTLAIEKLPHLLIAGATGSGKSVCINTILVSLLYRNNPDDLKLILVDPKRVELTPYNGLPYLLTPVITDTQKTVNALRWAVGEMDKRYQALSEVGKRNITDYNLDHPDKKLPNIVIVIDELADLMAVASQEVEGAIVRLAQMARAVGIHLVLATQRPSVDVITGLIKANITSRIAFAVASQTDSRTILDMSGAEKLLGRGDLLLTTAESSKPKRLQGAFVTDEEIVRITNYIKQQVDEVEYHEEIIKPKQSSGLPGDIGGDADPLLTESRRLVIEAGKASASYLQRRLRIGYSRAARLLDFLEKEGTIGPADGSRPRDVIVTQEDMNHSFTEFNTTESKYTPLPNQSNHIDDQDDEVDTPDFTSDENDDDLTDQKDDVDSDIYSSKNFN